MYFFTRKLDLLLLMFMLQTGVLGFVSLTCDPTDTAFGEPSTCTCTTDSGVGISWQIDGSDIMFCLNGGTCDTTLAEYDNGYSTSGANKVFTIAIKSFEYTDCSVLSCKDQASTDTDQQTLTLHELNGGTPSINSEPGSKTNGSIQITTGCVFKGSDIEVNWYSVDSTNESKTYSPDTLFKTQTTCSDATKVCSGENAVTFNTGFTHTEKTGECVKFRVEVFHPADPSNKLEWTTTGEYCIGGECACDDCKCKKKCQWIVILSIIMGLLGIPLLPATRPIKEHFGRKTALVVDFIGIVFGVISLVLGIVVQVKDCCEYAADCCKDLDCCKDECKRNRIENTGVAFIVIGALVGIAGGVIFYLLWSNRMGPGNNGITKKLLHELESAYPKILSVKDLIRKVDAEESVVMEQLEELRRKDLIRQLDSGGFVRHFLDVKTRITKQDLRPWEEIVREMLLHVLESVYPNILSVKDLISIDFAEESVVMEQLEELRRKDLIRQLDSGGFVRHFLDVKTAYKAEEAKEPGENDRMMETSN